MRKKWHDLKTDETKCSEMQSTQQCGEGWRGELPGLGGGGSQHLPRCIHRLERKNYLRQNFNSNH
jgi:hypothetical protein